MAYLILPTGESVTFDDNDSYLVLQYSWSRYRRESDGRTYAKTSVKKSDGTYRTLYMHRLILGEPDSKVDHRDGDGLNNQRYNLREATTAQNAFNSGPREGSSRYKGVYRRADGKWISTIRHDGVRRHIGVFDDEVSAARAYNDKAVSHHGEFARLNAIVE